MNVRVVDNGDDYDDSLNDVSRNSAVEIWDPSAGRLLTTDAQQLTTFRNQLRWLHIGWNLSYLDLLESYQQQLDALIGEIEASLRRHGADG